jgi:GLPGLI family protein
LYVLDSVEKSKIHTETMVLYANNYKSAFLSYTKKIEDSVKLIELDSMIKTKTIVSQKRTRTTSTAIYREINNDTVYTIQNYLTKDFLIKNYQPKIKWHLLSDSVKKINNYSCIKATCYFKGRNYDVWFTPEIPIPFGPWKLSGLPGLILEATDTKNEISFIANEINNITYPNNLIALPKNYIITTNAAFDKFKEYYTNNPEEALKVILGNNDFSLKIITEKENNKPTKKMLKPANPIELTD